MLSYRSFLVIPLAILLCCKDSVLKPFTENGLWGFKDADGNIRIEAKYDDTGAFSKGLARVRLGNILTGKYGFINTKGEEVITLKYDYVEEFSEGLVLVRLNGKYGFINPKGEVVIPLKFDNAGSFSNSLALVNRDGNKSFINTKGEELISLAEYDVAGIFSEGLAWVGISDTGSQKYGFINPKGEVVIPIRYDDVGDFTEGLAWVGIGDPGKRKYGFINPKGEVVIPFKYSPVEGVSQFKDGLAFVIFNGQWGFIDKSGNEYWTEDEGKARRQMKNR